MPKGFAVKEACLVQAALAPPRIPRAEATLISWAAVADAVTYLMAIKNAAAGLDITMALPAAETGFRVPPGWLGEGIDYKFGLAAIDTQGRHRGVKTEVRMAGTS